MKAHQLKIKASQKRRRAGRGIAAGRGKTAGRGTKGQLSRSGGRNRIGFEGGQNPLMRRLPKLRGHGFRKPPKLTQTVYTEQLATIKTKSVDNFNLAEAGLIADAYRPVKLIVKGQLKRAKSVKLQRASAGAIKQLAAAGGSFKPVARPQQTPKTKDKAPA